MPVRATRPAQRLAPATAASTRILYLALQRTQSAAAEPWIGNVCYSGGITPAHNNQRAAGKTSAPTANKYPDMVSTYFNRKPCQMRRKTPHPTPGTATRTCCSEAAAREDVAGVAAVAVGARETAENRENSQCAEPVCRRMLNPSADTRRPNAGRRPMVNTRGAARLGMLAVGLGVGAAMAHSPVASADSSTDWLSSIDSSSGWWGPAGPVIGSGSGHLVRRVFVVPGRQRHRRNHHRGLRPGDRLRRRAPTPTADGGTGDYALADGTNAFAVAGGEPATLARITTPRSTSATTTAVHRHRRRRLRRQRRPGRKHRRRDRQLRHRHRHRQQHQRRQPAATTARSPAPAA